MNATRHLLNDLGKAPRFTRDKERHLHELAQGGDLEARNQLVLSQVPWIVKLCGRYRGQYGIDEAVQMCVEMLMRKIGKLDPDKGRLTTLVGRAVPRFLATEQGKATVIETPKTETKHYQDVARAQNIGPLTEAFLPRRSVGMNTRRRETDSPREKVAAVEQREALLQHIGQLEHRDQVVLLAYYYLGLNMKQIGCMWGVTRERVRQLRNRALRRLKKMGVESWGEG